MAASVQSVIQLRQRFDRVEQRLAALEHVAGASEKIDAHIEEQAKAKQAQAVPVMDTAQILEQIAALTAIVQKNTGVAPGA